MKKFWAISLGIIVFFTIAYILLVLNKYWQFEYFFRDNVYIDSALWKVANLQTPIVRHSVLGNINYLGDHFDPTIFLLSPIYRLFPFQETILTSMVILYSLTAFIGLAIGQKLIKNKFILISLLIAFFLYRGAQNAFLFGFHGVSLISFFFVLSIYFLITNKTKLFFLAIVMLLLSKESAVGIVSGIGVFMFFASKEKRRIALVILALAVSYYFLVTRIVIPGFSGGRFLYSEFSLSSLIFPPEKITTFIVSISSFGFLPVISGAAAPLFLQDFLIRYLFAIPGNVQYTLNYHYNIATASLLFFSSIWAVHLLEKNKQLSKLVPLVGVIVLGLAFYFHRFTIPRGPLELVFNRDFYKVTANNSFLWQLISKTPKKGKIMTQNHLGYSLSHTNVFEMSTSPSDFNKINPDYIVLDLREGQNPNNFVPITQERTQEMVALLKDSGRYKIFFNKDKMLILSKIKDHCFNLKNPYCIQKI